MIERGDWHGEVESIKKNKETFPALLSLSTVSDEKGNPIAMMGAVRDITERKRAEEVLRESEGKYRGLVNNIKLGVFRTTPGPTGRFLEVNPAMEEITGYSREELLQMNVSDLYVHPEQRKAVLEEIGSATGKATKELRFRKKNGTEIVVSDTKVTIRDDGGEILYFDGIIEDITEHKRMEQALKESEEGFRHIFDHASDSITVTDRNAVITKTNKRTVEMHGFSSKDKLVGKSASKLVSPRDRRTVGAKIEKAIREGAVIRDMECILHRADGSEFPGELSVSELKDASGNHIGTVTIARDITERKRMEQEIQEKMSNWMPRMRSFRLPMKSLGLPRRN